MSDQFKQGFHEEARELIGELESALLELDQKRDDPDILARAFRALHTIKGSGAMFGFDDVAASSLYTPPLTTVRQPMEIMGAMAVSIIVDGINAVQEKREVSAVHRNVAPELAVRESTRSLF